MIAFHYQTVRPLPDYLTSSFFVPDTKVEAFMRLTLIWS